MVLLTAIACAGILAIPVAAGSFKLPMTRREGSGLARRGTDDTTVNSIYSGMSWTVQMAFGNQNFSVQVDTGSSDL